MQQSCLYVGEVMHRRLRPFGHRFRARVFSLWLDLDELAALDRRLRLFSHNRWNLFGFNDRDHGAADGSRLRSWCEAELAKAGIALQGGPIRLLCFPRVLGYVFDPLTVWFCYHRDGRLLALIYEVRNTFGERHGYLLPLPDEQREREQVIVQACGKDFYVSPYLPMEARYRFRLREPQERLSLLIQQSDAAGALLVASLVGRRRALSDRQLLALFFSHPLMTLKVIGAIHWQALRLWMKGAAPHPRPAPPGEALSLVRPRDLAEPAE